MKFLVAGAGIGGLTAALALLKFGFDVEIYEQADELGEIGAGVQISANGSHVLRALGLEQELAAVGLQPELREVRLWDTGRSWTQIALGATSLERYGAPHYTVHRADLHAMLVAAVQGLKPDAIKLGARCIGSQQDATGLTLMLAEGVKVRGDALIGADGIHSAIRSALFGADDARFTGCMAWRGLIPCADLPSHLTRSVNTNWIGTRAHIVTYPIRDGAWLNMVGVVERDWRVESWTQRGTKAECLADYPGWHDDVQTLLRHVVDPHKWALMLRDPLPHWTVGRATLLGDACHPTLPFMGQGAVMAIEDGFILARCCAASPENVESAFKAYEATRVERTTRLVAASAENMGRLHSGALARPGAAEEHISTEFAQKRVSDRFDWLYSYDAVTTAIG